MTLSWPMAGGWAFIPPLSVLGEGPPGGCKSWVLGLSAPGWLLEKNCVRDKGTWEQDTDERVPGTGVEPCLCPTLTINTNNHGLMWSICSL